jgi:hypothetical protein
MRNIHEVTKQICDAFPDSYYVEFKERLTKISNDSVYRAPELQYMSWEKLSYFINCEIGIPHLDWHFEVYSILSTKTVEQIKQELKNNNANG